MVSQPSQGASLLLDPSSWLRRVQVRPEVGAELALFNGNVRTLFVRVESVNTAAQITGKVTEVERPKKFVTSWRAPTWPSGAPALPR